MPAPTIPTPTGSTLTETDTDTMISEVAELGGDPTDPDLRTKAIRALDRAADRLNMRGHWLFRRKTLTYSTTGSGDQLLSADDSTLTLPSDWAYGIDPIRVLGADSDLNRIGEWKSWAWLQGYKTDSDFSGVPSYFAIKSELDLVAHFYPSLDTSTTTAIEMTYVARVQRPSEASSLSITPETREALISGGMALFAQWRWVNMPQVWQPLLKDFYYNIKLARASTKRALGELHQTATVDEVADGPGHSDPFHPATSATYIKLP